MLNRRLPRKYIQYTIYEQGFCKFGVNVSETTLFTEPDNILRTPSGSEPSDFQEPSLKYEPSYVKLISITLTIYDNKLLLLPVNICVHCNYDTYYNVRTACLHPKRNRMFSACNQKEAK